MDTTLLPRGAKGKRSGALYLPILRWIGAQLGTLMAPRSGLEPSPGLTASKNDRSVSIGSVDRLFPNPKFAFQNSPTYLLSSMASPLRRRNSRYSSAAPQA
jgi:hypothetical protein